MTPKGNGPFRRAMVEAMGLNPFRQQRRSSADYVMVAVALGVTFLLVLWALLG